MHTKCLGLLTTIAFLAAAPASHADAPEAQRAEARELLAKLITYRTSEGLGQVPAMAQLLAERYRAGGFPEQDIHVLPSGETAALVVRYRGSGTGGRPILLLAHMDVVTANPQDWQRDPFRLIEENGFFFGRGSSDIKDEIALITTTLLRLKSEKFVPTRDLIVVFSGDEETDAQTSKDLLSRHRLLIDAEFALNGDGGGGDVDEKTGKPTFYTLQGAEKSYASYTLTTRNPGGHSSQPRPDNAIYELADALKAVQGHDFPVMWNEWTIGSFKAAAPVTPGKLGEAMARFAAHPGDTAAAATIAAEPAYVGRIRTTCVATLLEGGHADNALPQSAMATVNCRIFPGTTVAQVREQLQKIVGAKVEVKTIGNPQSGPPSPMRSDVLAAVKQAVHANYPGVPIVPDMAPYATDGTFFRAGGIPTYGVGSIFMKESDHFAHGLNERVPVAAFYAGLTHWYVLLTTLAGGK